jgi:hypothetical protein
MQKRSGDNEWNIPLNIIIIIIIIIYLIVLLVLTL